MQHRGTASIWISSPPTSELFFCFIKTIKTVRWQLPNFLILHTTPLVTCPSFLLSQWSSPRAADLDLYHSFFLSLTLSLFSLLSFRVWACSSFYRLKPAFSHSHALLCLAPYWLCVTPNLQEALSTFMSPLASQILFIPKLLTVQVYTYCGTETVLRVSSC